MVYTEKIIVGSEEWCKLPGLGVPAVKARVDSGAKTSSIHAFNIEPFHKRGHLWVRFDIHPVQRDRKTTINCEAPVLDRRRIKSSNGKSEKRYVISTLLELGEHAWKIELTLANRDSMGYRMLLGREAMVDRILIDPAGSMCLGEYKRSEIAVLYGIPVKRGGRRKRKKSPAA